MAPSRINTPCNRADHIENFEKHGLGDGGVKLSDVKGSRWSRSGRRWVVGHRCQYLGYGTFRNSNWNSLRLGNSRRRHDRLSFFIWGLEVVTVCRLLVY